MYSTFILPENIFNNRVNRGNFFNFTNIGAAENEPILYIPSDRPYESLRNTIGNRRRIAVLQTLSAMNFPLLAPMHPLQEGIFKASARHPYRTF